MNKWKNWLLGSGLVSILLFLSGCVRMDSNGNPDTSGIVYRVLVHPMGQAITYLVENFNWSYGWAVIAMTVIVRIIILPLGISQSKKTMIQSEKMQALKPQVEAAQQKLKAATTREEQMAAQAEMQQVYRENGLSMTGGIGCPASIDPNADLLCLVFYGTLHRRYPGIIFLRHRSRLTKYGACGHRRGRLSASRIYFNNRYS